MHLNVQCTVVTKLVRGKPAQIHLSNKSEADYALMLDQLQSTIYEIVVCRLNGSAFLILCKGVTPNELCVPFTPSIQVEILVVNMQRCSLFKHKMEKSQNQNVLVSIGK